MESRANKIPGFTLIELIITSVIVLVLAGIAAPSYINYMRRAHFSEIVQATAPFKAGVNSCFQSTGTLKNCNAGSHHIPAAITVNTGPIASLAVVNGVITVVPVAQKGIESTDTYTLTPTVVKGTLNWTSSGGGVAHGYAN